MSFDFNADEVFEMAEDIEKNGAQFYRRAAETVSDLTIRQLLLDLAAMEDKHREIFADMRAQLSTQDKEPTVFDPEDLLSSYLQAYASGKVFNVEADLADKNTIEDILQMAIGLEKDSVVFYLGMREAVPERLGKDKLDHIIREEMRHIALLNKKLTPA